MRIFGLILAGGTGSRMGGADKALLALHGRSLVQSAIERLSPQVEALAISANGDPARFAEYNLPVLPDPVSKGPLSGVLAGLDWAIPQGATAVVTVAVDTPYFPCDLVPQLCLAAEFSPFSAAVSASAGRLHPTFSLWPIACRDILASELATGKAKLMRIVDILHAARADFVVQDGIDPFMNLNTPDDLRLAAALQDV